MPGRRQIEVGREEEEVKVLHTGFKWVFAWLADGLH